MHTSLNPKAITMTCENLYPALYRALMEKDPARKIQETYAIYYGLRDRLYYREPTEVLSVPDAGRPAAPALVAPKEVPRRRLGTREGVCAMLHAIAHIEFNAINLSLDAAYRFQQMPEAYYRDWIRVAKEEAYHFSLIAGRLEQLGSHYGAFTAHGGLWQACVDTEYDVMVRMALVPRVMEARTGRYTTNTGKTAPSRRNAHRAPAGHHLPRRTGARRHRLALVQTLLRRTQPALSRNLCRTALWLPQSDHQRAL